MGLGYTNGLALGQELKKFREFKRMFLKKWRNSKWTIVEKSLYINPKMV